MGACAARDTGRSERAGGVPAQLGKLLDDIGHVLPFDFFYVFGAGLSGPRGNHAIEFYADNLPEALRQTYLAARWFESDPAYLAACSASQPLRTPEIRAAAGTGVARHVFEQMAVALGATVAAVPLRLRGRLVGGVAIWRRDGEFSDDELQFLELVAPALLLAATNQRETRPGDLTARERECLSWTSAGKTAWEIGNILGISEHTAVAHLNAAVRKLAAASRAHAVAEALRRGFID